MLLRELIKSGQNIQTLVFAFCLIVTFGWIIFS